MSVLLVIASALALILSAFLYLLNFGFTVEYPVAIAGILFEAAVLLALAMFFGSFAKPMMTVIFTVAIFLLGHWVDSLHFFIEKSKSESFKIIGKVVEFVVPNLEKFNWRSAPVYGVQISSGEIFSALWINDWLGTSLDQRYSSDLPKERLCLKRY